MIDSNIDINTRHISESLFPSISSQILTLTASEFHFIINCNISTIRKFASFPPKDRNKRKGEILLNLYSYTAQYRNLPFFIVRSSSGY